MSFLQVSPPKSSMHISPPSHMPHSLPFSFDLCSVFWKFKLWLTWLTIGRFFRKETSCKMWVWKAEYYHKMDLNGTGWKGVYWTHVACDRNHWQSAMNTVSWEPVVFSRRTLLYGINLQFHKHFPIFQRTLLLSFSFLLKRRQSQLCILKPTTKLHGARN